MTTEGNWRSLITQAMHQSSGAATRHLQLATVTPDGQAANRTLVFREFRDSNDDLCVHSDHRAQKVADLEAHPQAEICWWFDEPRDQFRLAGDVTLLTAETTGDDATYRAEQWEMLDDYEKALYVSPHPGELRADDEAFDQAFSSTPPDDPPDTFVVLLLSPTTVDHLSLKGHPHHRTIHTRTSDGWVQKDVNP